MSTYSHIKEDCQLYMSLSNLERINSLYEFFWINYPKTKEIINLLTNLMNRPKKPRMQNLLIIGESNIGKTSIITQFSLAHPDKVIEDEDSLTKAIKSVIVVQFPASADERGLYISILEQFWVPFKATEPVSNLRHQAVHLLRECGVKILIMDEVHNLLAGTAAKQRMVMNVLKSLGNDLQVSLVGVGTTDAALILNSDPQHMSRYDVVHLPKWELDKNFGGLLKAFELRLPLKKASKIIEKEKAQLLFTYSRGNLGDLHKLLIACAKQAIETGEERITADIIKNEGKAIQQNRVRV